MNAALEMPPYDDMLRAITARVARVLWGDGDPYLPPRYAQHFASARLTILPKAEHWVPLTEADELAKEILQLV